MTFGMCLKLLLTTYNIRMNQLAKAINVDSSLVSKWVHEKRIPSDLYIHAITEVFTKTKVTPLQINLVEELTKSFNFNHSSDANIKEKIECILRLSLDNSLRVQKKKRNSQLVITKPFLNNSISLSEHDKLIYDIENIYDAFLSLLDLAVQGESNSSKKIYISYYNNLDQPFLTNERLNTLKQKLLESIKDNWEITFLLRLDSSIDGVIKFIHFLLPLIKTGRLKLFYMKNDESFMTRKELYIVTGLGALSCFPSAPYSGIRCAFFLRNPSAVDVLSNYANLLIESNSNDVIEYYKNDMNGLYFSTLTNAIDKRGNQYSYNNSFSNLLIPQSLYIKFIHQTDLSPQDKERSFYYYKKQFDGFYKNLQNYIYKDIYFISILDKLCEDKILYLYTYSGIKIITMETRDIIEYLEYVIDIITTYTNYHIAIVSQDSDDFIKNITLTIKERQMIFLDVFELTKRESDVRLSISDPVIVKAFVDYYQSLWSRISPLNKDKSDIILLMQSYIKTLKNEL